MLDGLDLGCCCYVGCIWIDTVAGSAASCGTWAALDRLEITGVSVHTPGALCGHEFTGMLYSDGASVSETG